jgi:exopolysaccharide biosynthesis WecB/TagA/CpsF family protein
LPIAVGALLDFLSGMVPRAPAWMRRLRLEWVFRLIVEPGRLWRRYILGNPVFLARVMRQKLSSTVPAETRP